MNGFINLFKEPGLTSNSALSKLKRLLGEKKAGFLGTLDPSASGVLPVGLGFATKFFPYFEKTAKTYKAEIIFGFQTDTQDATGKTTKTGSNEPVEKDALIAAFAKFTGEISQIPPMYSAKKINGKRLYEIARKGGNMEREAKQVTVHSIELDQLTGTRATFTAKVSTGTYIRTLCEDMGKELGQLAHMGTLTRTVSHLFNAEEAWKLGDIEKAPEETDKWLLPMDFPLQHLERIDLSNIQENAMMNGTKLNWQTDEEKLVRVYGNRGNFIGVGKVDAVVKKLMPAKFFFNGQ